MTLFVFASDLNLFIDFLDNKEQHMKRFFSRLIFSSILSIRIFAQTDPNLVTVTVDGYSYLGEDETLQQAKQRAIQDAERNAVEKGTGIHVESFSRVNQNMLIDDEILTVAGGYISDKKVLVDRLEAEPPRYHIQIEAEVKCGDLEKLIAAKKAEQKSERLTLAVDFAVVAERKLADGTWGELNVRDGGEMKSFDKFQVLLKPHTDCHAYLLFYDSSGKASLLFPSKEPGGSAFLKMGTEAKIPGDGLYFELDDKPGLETLYLLASPAPLADVEWLLEKMEKAGMDSSVNAALSRSIATRGISRIVPGAKAAFTLTGGKTVEKVTELVMGKGSLMRKLGFNHSR
jgi:hypothetical protein